MLIYYDLIKSYLSNRTQYVKIEDTLSKPAYIKYGIPQGTVLGPILFSIYINSLLSFSGTGNILSLADDTAVIFKANSWKNLKTTAKQEFKKIKDWFDANKLTVNFNKTVYLPFTSYVNSLPNLRPLNIDNNLSIPESESIKYFGIIVDRHFRWNLQIKHVVEKLRGMLSRIKHLKKYLDVKQLKIVYYALVESQIKHGIIGWEGAN